jgi:hypothetical protein
MKRSPLTRRAPLRRSTTPMRRTKLNPVGKQGRRNSAALDVQTQAFRAVNLYDYCEARFAGCSGRLNLHFAHAYKRDENSPDELIYLVIRACDAPCHAQLDQGTTHAEMARAVLEIILSREPINHPFFKRARALANAAVEMA